MTALVILGHHKICDQQFHHGDELPPDLLPPEAIDWHLDRKELVEYKDRRSLYRLFPAFSGCKEQEQLSESELTTLGLEA